MRYLRGDPVSVARISRQQLPVSHSDGGLDGRVPHGLGGVEPQQGRRRRRVGQQQRLLLGHVLVLERPSGLGL